MHDSTYVQLVKLYCNDSKKKERRVKENLVHPELEDLGKKIVKQLAHDLKTEMVTKIKMKSTISETSNPLLYNMYNTEIEFLKAQIQYLKN